MEKCVINVLGTNYRIIPKELKNADIVIQPDLREKAHIFDVQGRQDTIQAGVDAAMERIKDLETVLKMKRSQNESVIIPLNAKS